MRPQSRTGVSVPRPPSDNIIWMLDKMGAGEQGTETLFYYGLPRRSRIVN